MNEIFTVWIVANYYYDEDGQKCACYPEEREWVDSYWTDEAAAVAEAERLWSDDSDEMYEKIVVFGRKLDVSGAEKTNGIASAIGELNVGVKTNIYFLLIISPDK